MTMVSTNIVVCQHLATPVGQVTLGAIGGQLCLCDWENSKRRIRNDNRLKCLLKAEYLDFAFADGNMNRDLLVLHKAEQELYEYFSGKRKSFGIPLLMVGTDFQKRVWQALMSISYGSTVSYMDIARRIGNPKSVRAVAQAIGSNPLSIFVPCHRVVGSDGTLTGYAGGVEAKRFLLQLEDSTRLV